MPSRHRFSSTLKDPPWTDGKGNQENYFKSVKQWKTFHERLPDDNNNKIGSTLQGMILQSQLFGRASDICEKFEDAVIQSEGGAMAIARAIHKQDSLSAITDSFAKFMQVLSSKCGDNESFVSFESRFDAQVCKYNATANDDTLPESLISFLLLANANIDDNQRTSILAAVAPKNSVDETNTEEDENAMKKINYKNVASIIRACDKPKANVDDSANKASNTLQINSVYNNRYKNNRRSLSLQEVNELKRRTSCKSCRHKGHWANDNVCPKNSNQSSQENKASQPPSSNKVMQFHMSHLTNTEPTSTWLNGVPGSLVDDSGPYSGIGLNELKVLRTKLNKTWNGILDPVPDCVSDRPYWQYGTGAHSSERKQIIGSVVISINSNHGNKVDIRHVVIEGSSTWIIGRSVTNKCIINHINGNKVELPIKKHNKNDFLQMIEYDMHSYIQLEIFYFQAHQDYDQSMNSLCSHSGNLTWTERKNIIEKVHNHVCGHSNYYDIKTLLDRNEVWNEDCSKYLCEKLTTCPSCHDTDLPTQARAISLNNFSRGFNELLFIDHFFPDNLTVFHFMDSVTKCSTGVVISSTNMGEAIDLTELSWITPYWNPKFVQGDKAFNNSIFKQYSANIGSTFRPSPSRRHHKNALESKDRVITDTFLRLQASNSHSTELLLATQAIRISNDLYGNDVASANELAKGYTRPTQNQEPTPLTDDIREAHEVLIAKRKLNVILRGKSTTETPICVGDMVQVFIRQQNEKRGKWSDAKPLLKYDRSSQTVIVPGRNGKTISAALEDTRHAITTQNDLVTVIQQAIEACQEEIELLSSDDRNEMNYNPAST